jgi:glutamine amidotransferase
MGKQIVIVDYDTGNLRSVQKALEQFHPDVVISRDPKRVIGADGLVLPGVGAFRDGMEALKRYELICPITDYITSGRPFLGICLGMHLLFSESFEFGRHRGLDIVKGKVIRFTNQVKVPHMGWNRIRFQKSSSIFNGIDDGAYFYFVHSYFVIPEEDDIILSITPYDGEFTSAIGRKNCFATQFHPEKSQKLGLKIMENFSALVRSSNC